MFQPVRPNTMHGTNANSSFQNNNVQNNNVQNNNLINNVYDPTKQNNPPYKTIYQPTPTQTSASINTSTSTSKNNIFSPPSNTSKKQYNTKSNANSNSPSSPSQYADRLNNNIRPQGLPTHPNMINNTQQDKMNNILAEKISDKIYNHFKIKYPTTIEASGFNKSTIETIVKQAMKKQPLNEKGISKIIDIIDHKFKTTINGDNRRGVQYDTTNFSMDPESKISMEKYLENYTNKVSILLDSDKTVEAELPKNMAPATDMTKIDKPEPFSEDFPIRDREKQTDMMLPELREYDYYVVINSNDRNTGVYTAPNNFVIDFAPAPPANSTDIRKGYIERNFNNIRSCELMNVIIRDTSDQADSSDAGGKSFPYLLLEFDELQRNYYGTNDYLSKAFAILTDYSTVGKYKYYRMVGDSSENTVTRVYNPRINLNKITTKLLLPDGTPFNFGTVNDNDTSNACISFGLRVVTIQKNLATQFINNA
jgi:hypothetical protein